MAAFEDEDLSDICRIEQLEQQLDDLQSYNDTLHMRIFDLETENEEIKEEKDQLKSQVSDMQAAAEQMRMDKSEIQAKNRSNERRVKELQKELETLKNTYKTREFIQEDRHRSEIARTIEERTQTRQERENMYQRAIDNMQDQYHTVFHGLREEGEENRVLVSKAMRTVANMHTTNMSLLVNVARECPHLLDSFRTQNNGNQHMLSGFQQIEGTEYLPAESNS